MHDDLVKRDFTAGGPNELWLADITEHRTGEGKLYLCAIKDVWSNRIVGYSIDTPIKSRLAVAALHNAAARRSGVAGCVLHTDRGSQFRSRRFVRALHHHNMVGSMGRVGAAGDNAAMESFFGLLQNNVLDRRTWARQRSPLQTGRKSDFPMQRIRGQDLCLREPRGLWGAQVIMVGVEKLDVLFNSRKRASLLKDRHFSR